MAAANHETVPRLSRAWSHVLRPHLRRWCAAKRTQRLSHEASRTPPVGMNRIQEEMAEVGEITAAADRQRKALVHIRGKTTEYVRI